MNLHEQINELSQKFDILKIVDLSTWTGTYDKSRNWLEHVCRKLHQDIYKTNQRIIFTHNFDFYSAESDNAGIILRNLQIILNQVDISNFFVTVLTTNVNIKNEIQIIDKLNQDKISLSFILVDGEFKKYFTKDHSKKDEIYRYGSTDPIKIKLADLTDKEKYLLTKSSTFCIYPWIHLHAYPTGEAYPCCHAEMGVGQVGNCRTNTLEEIWHDRPMVNLRNDMLSETKNPACNRCYEQEESGFFSGRRSANKHHGHQIGRINDEKFEMTYWDIRFSNLCNLKCRSCGHIFSSQWYQDQAKLAGSKWKERNTVLNYAGRTETDMWEQLLPHIDYVEQVYFAGGEPLLMEEHYQILDELVRRRRFDVRLIYNTNFTHTDLKGQSVFEYWRQFDSVAVGASLDAMGPRAEYIRKGTDWSVIENNRREMIQVCPDVDFYISPTLSILNVLQLPDFHQDWVNRGLLNPQDLNINILQDPKYLRIDIATTEYKNIIQKKYQAHLEWLKDQDPLQRATQGFKSAINFMFATDNTHLIDIFWQKTHELDNIRNERILDIIPELATLK